MKNKILIFIALGALSLGSCKKEKGYEIEIISPAKNGVYSSPVPVEVHIHGEEIIHDIEIKVFKKSDPSDLIFDYHGHVEVKDFTVSDQITVTVSGPTVFTIEVKAGEYDHITEVKHDFTIQP